MKFVKYNESYLDLLEKYFKHPDTPYNNSNHDMFLTELYDDERGVLFLAIDNDEIVGTNSAILVNEKNMEILSGSFDPTIVEDSFIENVIGTVNP